jgi:hypothetical protein
MWMQIFANIMLKKAICTQNKGNNLYMISGDFQRKFYITPKRHIVQTNNYFIQVVKSIFGIWKTQIGSGY